MLAGSAQKGGAMWPERSADLCRTSTRRRSRGRRIPDIDPTVGENYWSIRQLSGSRSAAGWINSRQEPNLISFEPTGSPSAGTGPEAEPEHPSASKTSLRTAS